MAPNRENLSAIVHGVNDMRLEKIEIPDPKEHEVLIRMGAVGICGTDVHCLTKDTVGGTPLNTPIILGHEAAGTVVRCGSEVVGLKPGDRVAIEPGESCRRCKLCKTGGYHLCREAFKGSFILHKGCLTHYYTNNYDFSYKLPDNVSLEEGAFLEPFSVAVYSCVRAKITLGHKVLITGAGSIGLLVMMAAREMGATHICITDINESRLEFASKLGAQSTLLVKRDDKEEELVAKVEEKFGGERPDVAIECAAAESSLRLAILATKPAGAVSVVGIGKENISIPMVDAAMRDIDIRGIFRSPNCFALALEMIASGRVDVKPLITHRYKLSEIHEAFKMSESGKAIKVMVNCE